MARSRSRSRSRERSRERSRRSRSRSRSRSRDRDRDRDRDRREYRGRERERERGGERERERERGGDRERGRRDHRERDRRDRRDSPSPRRRTSPSRSPRRRSPSPLPPPAPAPATSADEEKERRRKKLEAWKAQKAMAAPAPAAPAPAEPPAPAPKARGMFNAMEEDDDATRQALQAERREKLKRMQREMQEDKYTEAIAAVAPSVGAAMMAASSGEAGGSAADDEVDPLDAFMAEHVAKQAEKDAERAAMSEELWQAMYGKKEVIVSDELEKEHNVNAHCYVCKRWGHTKKDCPHKRCFHCGKEGHTTGDCPKLDNKIAEQFAEEKARKKEKAKADKKERRKKQWEEHLRSQTGVDGFSVLYEILGLPPRKLASKEQIKRAYYRQSLRYHPDRVSEEEAEEAAEKFVAVKAAYELLVEGMETGGKGMGGAVFSGGDLEYSGGPKAAVAPDEEPEGGADAEAAEAEADWLDTDEIRLLLATERVRSAVEEIVARPAALARYESDPVVMGVLYSLNPPSEVVTAS